MNAVQLRKQALLIESELHRATLRADLDQLAASTAWIDGAVHFARQSAPLVLALGAGAGLLLVRGVTGSRGGGGTFSRLLRWGQTAYTVWQGFAAWRQRPPVP